MGNGNGAQFFNSPGVPPMPNRLQTPRTSKTSTKVSIAMNAHCIVTGRMIMDTEKKRTVI